MIRDTSADLISVKIGINVVNGDVMRLRAFVPAVHGFLDTIRDGHPDTPVLPRLAVVLRYPRRHTRPVRRGSGHVGNRTGSLSSATGNRDEVQYGRLTLKVIREAMQSLREVRADDENLHYLDGTRLYAEADTVDHPLPDGLHPDTATHQLIGERFADHAFTPSGPFGAVPRVNPM